MSNGQSGTRHMTLEDDTIIRVGEGDPDRRSAPPGSAAEMLRTFRREPVRFRASNEAMAGQS
jgi:hypothetical protein